MEFINLKKFATSLDTVQWMLNILNIKYYNKEAIY